MQDKTSHRRIILCFFLSLFLISCLLTGWLLLPFLSIIVMASVVTSIFSPVYHLIRKKFTSSFSSFTTCVLIFLILFVPIVFFVGVLSKEAYDLYLMARGVALSEHVNTLLENSKIIERANMVLSKFRIELAGEDFNNVISEIGIIVGRFLYEQTRSIATNILTFFINFFFMLLIIYFLLIDGARLVTFIKELSPLPDEQDEKLIQKFRDMSGAILVGNGLCGMIQGLLGGVLFAFFGLKSSFLWGVVMTLLAFLPIIGIGVVFVPAAIYLFLKGRIAAGIFFLIFYAVLSGGIEYLFKPRVVGKRVQMHTLLVFLAIMGGLKLFGILGIIYGPLIVTTFLTLTDIYHSSYQMMIEADGIDSPDSHD